MRIIKCLMGKHDWEYKLKHKSRWTGLGASKKRKIKILTRKCKCGKVQKIEFIPGEWGVGREKWENISKYLY